jgi:excisionase family DNA binding protein
MQTLANPELVFLTPSEVAGIARVHRLTVYRWISEGKLRAVRLGETGQLRVPRRELDRFLGLREAA